MVKKSLGSVDVADDCSNTNKNSIEISSDSESSESSVSGGLCEELRSKCQILPKEVLSTVGTYNDEFRTGDLRRSALAQEEEEFLFDPVIIDRIDMSQAKCTFKPEVSSASAPAEGFIVRPLSSKDYDRGFLEILSQLTSVGNISKDQFTEQFNDMRRCSNTYFITVIVDTNLDKIVGAGTMVQERKFIHQCGSRGLIEDIIVNNEYRGKQLGKILLAILVEVGKQTGCYKITLNCKDELVRFYNSFGLVKETGNANFMVMRVQK